MANREEEIFTAPVWWDPKMRKVMFKTSNVVPGVLAANLQGAVFATPKSVVFEVPLERLTVMNWDSTVKISCDINAAGSTYRLYFSPPVDGVPRLSANELEELGDKITGTATVAGLTTIGVLASMANLAQFFGLAIKGFSVMKERKQGRRLLSDFQALIEHY